MKRNRLHVKLCAIVLGLMSAGAAGASGIDFEEGIASAPGRTGELYREQHWTRRDGARPLERLVIYRCPDGRAFARKRVDYTRSELAPAFKLEDARSGYVEGLRGGGKPTLFFNEGRGGAERSALVTTPDLVADAGFDQFIRRNWTTLAGGKGLPLAFAVPSRLRSMAFSVTRVGEGGLIAGEKSWLFRLKLDGWLGLVAPSIDVSYGQQSRRLLRFEGLSNLRDDRGDKPLIARIDFKDRARAASSAEFAAARDTPLSACKTGQGGGRPGR